MQLKGQKGGLSPEALARLNEEQIGFILRYTPGTMIATICNGFVCVLALCQTYGWASGLAWGLCLLAVVGPTGLRRIRRRKPSAQNTSPARLIRKATLNAFLLGCCWGAVPFFFFDASRPQLQLVIACLSAGMLSAGFFALASIPRAAIAYGAPLVIGFFLALERLPGHSSLITEALVVSYVSVLLVGMAISFNQLKTRVLRQMSTERELRRDPATALPNRLGLREALDKVLETGKPLTVISAEIVGLDHALELKDIDAERILLLLVANRIRTMILGEDLLARMTEDRFLVVLWNCSDEAVAASHAERIAAAFSAPFEFADRRFHLTATLGIAMAPRDGTDSISLVRNSDIALYEAKQHSGRPYEFFQPQLDERVMETRQLTSDLKDAIASEALWVVFQPIQDLASRSILGCEALVRWTHPTRGNIPPTGFIPLAEESGLIHDLGLYVLRQAVRTAKAWPEQMHVAVNVSPVQLENRDFPARLLEIIQQEGFPPARLTIEITETALFRDGQLAMGSIEQISELGVALSLDDFGTGYSSLNYIRHYPLSYIKIDKSFIDDVLQDPGCAAIVKGLIRMAHDLGIGTVAEGVETAEQYEWLIANGCTYVQGYLISRPVAAADLCPLLQPANTTATAAAE